MIIEEENSMCSDNEKGIGNSFLWLKSRDTTLSNGDINGNGGVYGEYGFNKIKVGYGDGSGSGNGGGFEGGGGIGNAWI